jgi:hypothetical protein
MKKVITAIAAPILLLLLLFPLLAGCSSDGAQSPNVTSQDQTSAPTPTVTASTPASRDDFATAVKFTQHSFDREYNEADDFVAPGSAADRYVLHRKKFAEALEIDGWDENDDSIPAIVEPDMRIRTIKIEETSYGKEYKYVWKDFTFDPTGKVSGWTGGSGNLASVLWNKDSKDSASGLTGQLVSAYRADVGNVEVVIEFKAYSDVSFYAASYSPRSGYRRDPYNSTSQIVLNKGDKTLGYFVFKNTNFGGKLRIEVVPSNVEIGDSTSTVELVIK